MANKRGAHQRRAGDGYDYVNAGNQAGANRQSDDQRAAYERAYRDYVRQQAASQMGRGAQRGADSGYAQQTRQIPQGQASYQQRPQYATYGQSAQRGAFGAGQNWGVVPKKKGHPVRNAIIVLLLIVIIVGGFAGFTGYTLYNSAKTVKAEASAAMTDISDLKAQLLSEDPSQANATANDIAKRAKKMKSETEGWQWSVASYVPVYGGDVAKVKELANVFDNLAKDAVIPLTGELSQVSLKKLFVDGGINVEYAKQVVNAVDSAAPVIEACASKLDTMGDAKLDQVNAPLNKARDTVDKLNTMTQFVASIAPTFSDMIGADGSPRTYLICAQQPAEVRSTGGLMGSVGSMTLDNGRISLNDFRTIGDIYPDAGTPHFEVTDEESSTFGGNASWVLSTTNYIPDWPRVSEIVSYYWAQKGYGSVNGVIGVDPVFLQHLLAMTGPVTTPSGITVDGSNAARFLGHDAYYIESDEIQNAVFSEIGAAAFSQLISHIGDVPIMSLAQQVAKDAKERHFQVCMFNENEENAMRTIGVDGAFAVDPAKPVLGVYANDDSWSKLCWYLKISNEVGQPVNNSDGTITYHVVTRFSNMIQPGSESDLSDSMIAHNVKEVRSPADMMQWLMLSAPAGGSIANLSTDGYFTAGMGESHYRDVQMFIGHAQFDAGETVTLSYDVIVPKEAAEPLEVVTSPTYQEVAGW